MTTTEASFSTIIKKVFPKAIVDYVPNFDDQSSGFDIAPQPGVLIRVKIGLYENPTIHVAIYVTAVYSNAEAELKTQSIYIGRLTINEQNQPDWYLFELIFRNWKNFR